jgi:hypothetical protein
MLDSDVVQSRFLERQATQCRKRLKVNHQWLHISASEDGRNSLFQIRRMVCDSNEIQDGL